MIVPLDDRVLVRVLKTETKTEGGIFLPDTSVSNTNEAIIVAVGTDEDLREVLKVGDKVIYQLDGGEPVKYNGRDYVLLERMEIFAKIEKGEI